MSERLKHPFVWLLVLMAAGIGSYWYWDRSRQYESTDNAYVDAHLVRIAAQVSGQVIALQVEENQPVKQGALLLQIDPAPFAIAVERATAQLDQARYHVHHAEASLREAEAVVRQREAELQNARADHQRTQELLGRHLVSREQADQVDTRLKTAVAALDSARAHLAAERANLGSSGEQNELVRQAQAALDQAQWDLRNTRIEAPVSGEVTNLQVRAGDTIAQNQVLFEIIDNAEFWIDANFKETQLRRIRPGLSAEVRIDMYPDRVFHGRVSSISGGSGTAFSLLPPQNATGNWVKVTQRVPVRIEIMDVDPQFPLRIGTSGSVRVDLGSDS